MGANCDKCGQVLEPGALRYGLKIELVSVFDGYIQDTTEDIDEELAGLIDVLSQADPVEIEKDVAQTIELVICRMCRNALVKEWDVKPGPSIL